jgi:hypothetical protein
MRYGGLAWFRVFGTGLKLLVKRDGLQRFRTGRYPVPTNSLFLPKPVNRADVLDALRRLGVV